MADEFCKVFNRMMSKYTIEDTSKPAKRKYHRDSTMSDAEIMVIMILFHNSGFRCLKHFYLDHVCKHLKHLFPKTVSYYRFVELQKRIIIPMIICQALDEVSCSAGRAFMQRWTGLHAALDEPSCSAGRAFMQRRTKTVRAYGFLRSC